MIDNGTTLLIEDAELLPGTFRNFTGREGMYNREGDRNFSIRLDPEMAQKMAQDGWNVKQLKPRGEATEGDYYLTVSVGFKNRPPLLVLISSKGRVNLSQHECDLLDWVDIRKADVILNAYRWDVQGKVGIKAYLKSLFITLEEDYLEQKYADVPMAIGKADEMLAIGPGEGQSPEENDGLDIVDAELVEE